MSHLAAAGGTPLRTTPYPSWPQAGREELEALQQVLDSGAWSSTHGTRVSAFEKRFAAYQEAGFGVCVNSGEAALLLSLRAIGLPPGAEVIVPAYTFVATATAVLQAGGIPVFADVDPHSWCLDPEAAEALVSPATAAIMPVHFGGLPADMGPILELAADHGLAVIEDAAQAWGARYRGRAVGAIGNSGAFSFHASKNLTAGEGGIVLTNEAELAARCRSLSDCGRAASDHRYTHRLVGGNYRMTEFQGAVLCTQLDRYPQLLERRRRNAEKLRRELAQLPGVEPQALPEHSTHAWHLVVVRIQPQEFGGIPKSSLVEALAAEGIPVTGGYASPPYEQPLFSGGEGAGSRRGPCPVAERGCASEVLWIRQRALLGSEEDALDAARAFAKVQRYRTELEALHH